MEKLTGLVLQQMIEAQTGIEVTLEECEITIQHYEGLGWTGWVDDSFVVPLILEENEKEQFWFKSSPFWVVQIACLALRLAGLKCKIGESSSDYSLEDLKCVKRLLKTLAPHYKQFYRIRGKDVKQGSIITTEHQLTRWLNTKGVTMDDEGLAGPYYVTKFDLSHP